MANSDGQVRIIIDTNANEAVKALDDTSKAFDNTGKSAQKAATVYDEYRNTVNQNIQIMHEMALGNMENSDGFKKLAQQTKDYQEQINKANSIVDKATGGVSKQANAMSGLTSMATKLIGGYIGIQGAIKAFNFSMESVAAFRTQERAIASLNTSLKNAGVYTAEYSAHIQSLASEIQKYSNYGDEAIIKAQALGQSFAGQVRFTDEATKAVVDFAAATGMDLEQAFTLVGKSVGSSTNALGRYGVELKKGMTDSQKMEAITKQLGDRYRGQAEQMADASVQLKNAIGDLKEVIGRQLNPAVEAIQKKMTSWVVSMTDAINKTRILKAEISQLNTNELNERLKANIEAMADLDAHYETKNLQVALAQEAKRNKLLQDRENIVKQIKELQKQTSNVKPVKYTDDIAISSGTTASGGKSSHVQQMKDSYEQLQEAVAKSRREIELAALKYGTSSEEVQQAFVKYRDLTAIQSEIAALFEEQKVKVEEQKGAYQQLTDKVSDLTEKLRDLAAENKIGSADWVQYKTDLDTAQAELENVNKSLDNNGVKLEDYSKKISSSISSGIISAVRNGGNAFEEFSSLAVSALQKVLDKLLEMSVVTPILNAFTGGTGGTIFSGITKLFGSADGNVFKNGNVIPFAKGGIVQQPTIFPMANGGTGLMGEAGAEAVMPLRRMSNGRLGVEAENSKTVQVNIYNQSGANVETRQRSDGSMDIFIKRVNEALSNERTSAGFRSAYSRENNKGIQAA